jgi:hypothetical protein
MKHSKADFGKQLNVLVFLSTLTILDSPVILDSSIARE